MEAFELKKGEEFITLNNLLKIESWVNSGGEAKQVIQNEEISVNGEKETRTRRKLRSGDVISFRDQQIKIA